MNQALSTQIPQIGDSSQQLLARMAAAAANQVQPIARVNWLASAARSTDQSLTVDVPAGVVGIVLRVLVTAVPGVSTLQAVVLDQSSGLYLSRSTASAAALNHLIILKRGAQYYYPGGGVAAELIASGLTEQITLYIVQSGAGSFTYSANYCFLKQ